MGFDPGMLEQFQALGALRPDGSIFRVLADRHLKPVDAALAIQLASRRYLQTRAYVEALGARAAARRPLFPAHEAYFLELLEEASEALRFTH